MEETTAHRRRRQPSSSRFGIRNIGGEIVEVQGGHIVRSVGGKDRHSKVCTAKGPRDRRVRLAAHTAIQFYDVQDRLGYDRPSKAVDWLIKKAQAAIDELEKLPAWTPSSVGSASNPNLEQDMAVGEDELHNRNQNRSQNQSLLPPSLDSDAIADTIKSFFPLGASAETASCGMQFHAAFPPPPSRSQDLSLSLQSDQQPQPNSNLFSGNPQLGYDPSDWSNPQPAEIGRFQRMISFNSAAEGCGGGGNSGGAFVFDSLPAPTPPLFGQTEFFSQRGPLQSSNTPSVRAWIDPSSSSSSSIATDHYHHHLYQSLPLHPSSMSAIGFASSGGFSGFRIPARIQGDQEEEHDGIVISDKPSSASSNSRH